MTRVFPRKNCLTDQRFHLSALLQSRFEFSCDYPFTNGSVRGNNLGIIFHCKKDFSQSRNINSTFVQSKIATNYWWSLLHETRKLRKAHSLPHDKVNNGSCFFLSRDREYKRIYLTVTFSDIARRQNLPRLVVSILRLQEGEEGQRKV